MRLSTPLLVLSFFLLSSCYHNYVMDEPSPVPGVGTGRRASTPGGNVPCREVGRSPCDVEQCKGANLDHVTLHCSGTRVVHRCVANLKCSRE